MKRLLLILSLIYWTGYIHSQCEKSNQYQSLETSTLKTNFTNDGVLWREGDTGFWAGPGLEYPKRTAQQIQNGDTAKFCMFSGAIWMSAKVKDSLIVSDIGFNNGIVTPGSRSF
jgi:hypothetical protein